MGKAIEQIAIARGHQIGLRIDAHQNDKFAPPHFKNIDIAIEFSRPEAAVDNLQQLMKLGIPTVCGTTGWLQHYPTIADLARAHATAFFYASNYSLGVNIFFEINKKLAQLMNEQPQYDIEMTEIHHTAKLDAPSGTAITLAEDIILHTDRKKSWQNADQKQPNAPSNSETIFIQSERIDPAPGTHIIKYQSAIDTLEIAHTAHSREGFATGAVVAAEWLSDKKGVFSMKDLLGF
jgi:4-hydroxy-tetrahydrodipicolinate reductase